MNPEVGARLVNRQIENIRAALIEQAELLHQVHTKWKQISSRSFFEDLNDCFRTARRPYATSGNLKLVDRSRHLLQMTYQKTASSSAVPQVRGNFAQLVVCGSDDGFRIEVPREPLDVSVEVWPYWVEASRRMRSDEFGSFDSMHEFARETQSATAYVGACIAECIRDTEARR